MDALRARVLRMADDMTMALRNAGQAFSFLSDGRDMVEVVESEAGLVARLTDHEDEGWPPLEFPLPEAARFHQATEGVLTRSAVFALEGDMEPVRAVAESAGLDVSMGNRTVRARLAGGAELVAREIRPGRGPIDVLTMIRVRQRRDPGAIVTALAGRANRSR
jgi:hypothetical protein